MLDEYLFSFPDHDVYVIADGAALSGLSGAIAINKPEHCCLYSTKVSEEMAEVAPYLIKQKKGSPLLDWLLDHWGNHFGILAIIPQSMGFDAVRTHFRKLLMVKHPEGRAVMFRYYDPRVLRRFLPMCTPEQIPELFAQIKLFVLEGKDATSVMRFWLDGAQIQNKESQFKEA